MSFTLCSRAMLAVGFIALAVSSVPALADDAFAVQAAPLYVEKESLAATMSATRARYVAWLAEQKPARAAVTLGPWHAAGPLDVASADRAAFLEQGVDLAAKTAEGKPLWTPRAGWKDGTIVSLPAPSGGPVVTYLFRTVTAAKPTTLTVGLGGGDRLEAWLNEAALIAADTALASERYGTGFKIEAACMSLLKFVIRKSRDHGAVVLRQRPLGEIGDQPLLFQEQVPQSEIVGNPSGKCHTVYLKILHHPDRLCQQHVCSCSLK